MFSLVFNSNTVGSATHDVTYPEILDGVNVQIDVGTLSAYNITIKARLDASLAWQTLKTITQADNPLTLLFELAAYPHYQVNLVSRTGSDPVKVAFSYAPDAASVVTTGQPSSEGSAIS